jgi:hypothetical protein
MNLATNSAMIQNASLLSLGMLFLGNDNKYTIWLIVIAVLYAKRHELLQSYRDFMNFGSKTLEIEGSIIDEIASYSRSETNFSNSINAVLYYIKNHKINFGLESMKSGLIVNALDRKSEEDNLMSLLPINNIEGMMITPEIRLYVSLVNSESSKKDQSERSAQKEFHVKTFRLKLVSKTLTVKNLYEFVNKCVVDYKTHLENEAQLSRIYEPCFRMDADYFDTGFSIPLKTSKCFDNLFFEGKEALIQRLDSFKDKATYERLGIQDALGLLFYGSPGTGKTSAIKAIAKYMNMSLIMVPMNQINSKKRLKKFFQTECYSGNEIPYSKRIYVLEEIDASNWGKIIRKRTGSICEESNPIPQTGGGSGTIIINSRDEPTRSKKDDEPLTLGAILEVIDGIIETSGRIIIMTTNHKELIDPALLRPGRIDFELEFKKLRRCDVASIYEKMYSLPIPKETLRKINDYTYSQAEISRLIFKHNNSPSGFLSEF